MSKKRKISRVEIDKKVGVPGKDWTGERVKDSLIGVEESSVL